jgi:hypothetical protein
LLEALATALDFARPELPHPVANSAAVAMSRTIEREAIDGREYRSILVGLSEQSPWQVFRL